MSDPSERPKQQHSLSRHTLRQVKFVVPGIAITYYLDTYHEFLDLLRDGGSDSWGSTSALASLTLGVVVIALFLYVLLVPWIRGIEPNYRSWRESGVLSSVIPILTTSILSGWSLLSFTLGCWTDLGYFKGVIAASGMYALAFGLMGLIPAPRFHRS